MRTEGHKFISLVVLSRATLARKIRTFTFFYLYINFLTPVVQWLDNAVEPIGTTKTY